MKKVMLLVFVVLLLLIILAAPGYSQTIWIADNNFNAPTGSHIFGTVQEAVDAASAGDTIYVQPSPTTYGNIAVNKQLTIVGIGFNLTKDLPLESRMGDITLWNNADNTSDASGTVIRGLTISTIWLAAPNGPAYTLRDIMIENCQLTTISQPTSSYRPVENLLVKGCLITSATAIQFRRAITGPSIIRNNLLWGSIFFYNTAPSNVIIANNLFYGAVRVDAVGGTTDVRNNNFLGQTGSNGAFSNTFRYGTVANNIFYGRTPSVSSSGGSTSSSFQLNIFTNNLSFGTGNDELPPSGGGAGNSGSGNIEGVTPAFVNSQLLNVWDASYDFTLQGGSAAIDAGSDGTDMGITGGPYPWALGNFVLLTTPIPTIETLNTSTVINPGDDLPVHINAKGN